MGIDCYVIQFIVESTAKNLPKNIIMCLTSPFSQLWRHSLLSTEGMQCSLLFSV